ncbi:hypothetical protein VSU01S_25890 [Vibrio superstes NBRC 103154]|uniref:Uncharacterized protein n=1 Tax=Vibrio superstes NBRC 103154 TaxID=1219062 RepID=A0A511QSM5_9VIBR|nr:hypothetical protein VSU01S_25890 [Vibrio superstes NBRC 103154]
MCKQIGARSAQNGTGKLLDIKGALVTTDGMACQTKSRGFAKGIESLFSEQRANKPQAIWLTIDAEQRNSGAELFLF